MTDALSFTDLLMLAEVDTNHTVIMGEAHDRIKTLVGKEGCQASGDRIGVTCSKLSHREDAVPIILILIDKDPQVLFYPLVRVLTMAISLRVVGS